MILQDYHTHRRDLDESSGHSLLGSMTCDPETEYTRYMVIDTK